MIEKLPIDMVADFPLDYLHLVCLGVVKKLLGIWINGSGPFNTKLSALHLNLISERMKRVSDVTPSEFSRKSRPLKEFSHYKATEFRSFVLYVGPVVLKDILFEEAYKHFLLLHTGITICSTDEYAKYLNVARKILTQFVILFKDLYGEEHISYNVHSLIHLVDDVERKGNVNNFSAFPFESKLGRIKRRIRAGRKPLQQISRRVTENLEKSINLITKSNSPILKRKSSCQTMYYEIHFENYRLDSTERNCWFLTDASNEIVKMIYAKYENGVHMIYGKSVKQKKTFFQKPFSSEFLKIYMTENLLFNDQNFYLIENIKYKLFCIKLENKLVFYPMIHSIM